MALGVATVLFEDALAERLRPINLTRPTFRISCGATTLERLAGAVLGPTHGLVRPHLAAFAPPPEAESIAGPTLFLNAALAPRRATLDRIAGLCQAGKPFLALRGQRITAAFLPDGHDGPLADPAGALVRLLGLRLPIVEDDFATFDMPFDVVREHEALIKEHLLDRIAAGGYREAEPGVFLAAGVKLPKHVEFDSTDGPIVLGENTRVRPFCYLAGPVGVGRNCLILDHSSLKHAVLLGDTVKAGGEIECSVVESYTNKQHHGFLGHAYVGSWVNLGAGTSNSDLKNTYGEVSIDLDGKQTPTGLQFAGCVIGDHTKTAINTSIFTGKLIGVASFVYGFVPSNVPSFTNYARSFGQVTEVGVEVAIRTQQRAAGRRKVELTDRDRQLFLDLFQLTRTERQLPGEQLNL